MKDQQEDYVKKIMATEEYGYKLWNTEGSAEGQDKKFEVGTVRGEKVKKEVFVPKNLRDKMQREKNLKGKLSEKI